jgi:hypothetical protein
LQGKFIREYSSIDEALHHNKKISRISIISCLKGKQKTGKGYQWLFKSEKHIKEGIKNIAPVEMTTWKNKGPVLQFSREGKLIKEFSCIKKAVKKTGINYDNIIKCLCSKKGTAGGFQWKRKRELSKSSNCYKIDPVKKEISNRQKSLLQFDLNGKYIKEYPSIVEASRDINVAHQSISCAVRNKGTSGGFQWRPIEDPRFKNGIIDIAEVKPKLYSNSKSVLQYTRDGNFVKEYHSVGEAARKTGITRECITGCAKGKNKTGGRFVWKYKKKRTRKKKEVKRGAG